MLFDDNNLAENKLILLYVLEKTKLPLSSSQITQIILENIPMNYFVLQQYIDELFQNNLISKNTSKDKSYYSVTKKGKEILELFSNRLSQNLCQRMDHYIIKHKNSIFNESHYIGTYKKKGDEEFIVQLRILENESELIDLSISVATLQQAKNIIDNWKNNGEKIYRSIINSLITKYKNTTP
ncbi:DUF4364 family protein [Garciella nitratireducens]|uniref:DUF4364 domain-containing protein n=1 Tax=Garciella nitratireducens DSM 15102 TaxID=1121911 RepID=A0A1T4LKY6_9FIRM|nr:DUF4364 family protein [Garciella nitratireducens]SJZ55311.1 protein of unknown function [Garciella nitratireducens DSM 15102]